MSVYVQYGSAAFALLAAVLWLWSAHIRLPGWFTIVVVQDVAISHDLQELGIALQEQSKWSAYAAVAAAISAVLAAIGTALQS